MTRAIQVFQVGVKAFLWHEQRREVLAKFFADTTPCL
jgi:hypothetical protein